MTTHNLEPSNKHCHLSLEDRMVIQHGLERGATRTAIAETLGKDKSTVAREVKSRKFPVPKSSHPQHSLGIIRDCAHLNECGLKVCRQKCENYQMLPCSRRDRKVGVCNGCHDWISCSKTHLVYKANDAHEEYLYTLSDSRAGLNITTLQVEKLAEAIVPMIHNGLSPYTIVLTHPELGISESCLYNYIDEGVFSKWGITNSSLHRKVRRKVSSSNSIKSKPREQRAYLKGRTQKDFEAYVAEHPNSIVTEMDTVYNDGSDGPFIQTFMLPECELMIGVLHDKKDAKSMVEGLQLLQNRLGKYFHSVFQVIITDRGTEFTAAEEFEAMGIKIFYADPQASWQKPHVENNHIWLRYIIPKKLDLRKLGLKSQD